MRQAARPAHPPRTRHLAVAPPRSRSSRGTAWIVRLGSARLGSVARIGDSPGDVMLAIAEDSPGMLTISQRSAPSRGEPGGERWAAGSSASPSSRPRLRDDDGRARSDGEAWSGERLRAMSSW